MKNCLHLPSFIPYKVQKYAATPEQLTLEENHGMFEENWIKLSILFADKVLHLRSNLSTTSQRLTKLSRSSGTVFSKGGGGNTQYTGVLISNRRTFWLHHVAYQALHANIKTTFFFGDFFIIRPSY